MWCGSALRRTRKLKTVKSWCKYCDKSLISGVDPKLNQNDYFDFISSSRFGLCLNGWGPKCAKDIEMMAMGTVPIVTPGVCTTYFNKWIEGIHYIKVNKPEEIQDAISRADWKTMSEACIEWYDKNCSPLGSFNTTMQAINSLNT
jgi:hypothetical protein